jgi:hypothetical protein
MDDKMLIYGQLTKKNIWVLCSLAVFSVSLLVANILMVSNRRQHESTYVYYITMHRTRLWLSRKSAVCWLLDSRYVLMKVRASYVDLIIIGFLGTGTETHTIRERL